MMITPLYSDDTPLADRLLDAAVSLDASADALQRFLSAEIEKSKARLTPCVCGHVAMFCACDEGSN